MKDSDFLDLANRVIDGAASEHDRAALDAVLNDSTQRRLEFEQLSALASILDAIRPVDPPADLRDRIMASIPAQSSRAHAPAGPGVWERVRDFLGARPGMGLVYAVVTGLVIGAVAIGVLSGNLGGDTSGLVGSMGAADDLRLVDQHSTAVGGIDFEGRLHTTGDRFVLSLDVSAETVTDVTIVPAGGSVSWEALSLPEQVTPDVRLEADRIVLGAVSGGRIEVSGTSTEPVRLQVVLTGAFGEEVLALEAEN